MKLVSRPAGKPQNPACRDNPAATAPDRHHPAAEPDDDKQNPAANWWQEISLQFYFQDIGWDQQSLYQN